MERIEPIKLESYQCPLSGCRHIINGTYEEAVAHVNQTLDEFRLPAGLVFHNYGKCWRRLLIIQSGRSIKLDENHSFLYPMAGISRISFGEDSFRGPVYSARSKEEGIVSFRIILECLLKKRACLLTNEGFNHLCKFGEEELEKLNCPPLRRTSRNLERLLKRMNLTK